MKNLVVVILLVSVLTAALSTTATCLALGWMAKSVSRAGSVCVDKMQITSASFECESPRHKIEIYATGTRGVALVKCVCQPEPK